MKTQTYRPNGKPNRRIRRPDDEPIADHEAEAAVLGAVLLSPGKLAETGLTPGDFHYEDCRLIFGAVGRLAAEGLPAEINFIRDELRSVTVGPDETAHQRIGGDAELGRIISGARLGHTPNVAHLAHHARRVRELAQRRRFEALGADLCRAARDGMTTAELAAFARDRAAEIGTAAGSQDAPAFARLIDGAGLLALDLKPRFLVRGVLAAGQPGVIGGRSKTLKTSLALDLAVSLGSGTPFLGRFEAERCRVAVWSGESGAATIRETALRIAAARGVELQDCDVRWCFAVPKLGRLDHLDLLRRTITEQAIGVAILDPLYLALLSPETAGQAGNLFSMGAALEPLSTIGTETGATIIVLHHFRKSGTPDRDEPASLEQLSQSGVAEWARQWLLLQRRSPYQADGHHELWLRAGGSAGHAALWAIDVDEGVYSPDVDGGGRTWDVDVRPVGDVRREESDAADRRKADQARQRDEDDCRRMLEALRRFPKGETQRVLSNLTGLRDERLSKALIILVGEGRVELCDLTKNRRKEIGYRPTGK